MDSCRANEVILNSTPPIAYHFSICKFIWTGYEGDPLQSTWKERRINTLRPRQNDHRFSEDTFKRIFLNENVIISIKISLKFVLKGPINNNPSLVQIMAWRRSGDTPLSEPMMVSLLTHICVTRPQWVKYFTFGRSCQVWWHDYSQSDRLTGVYQGYLLLTWMSFNLSMDSFSHPLLSAEWN